MTSGRNVLMDGNRKSSARWHKSASIKGITPRYKVPMGTSIVPAKPNKFIPNGGVIIPISTTRTIRTAYHIGLKPNATIIGKMIGTVKTITAKTSKIIPRRIYPHKINTNTTCLLNPIPMTYWLVMKGILVTAKKLFKIKAPIIRASIMAVILADSNRHSKKSDAFSCRLTRLISSAPKAPTAPASVGVKMPPYMPPIIVRNNKNIGQVNFRE